VKSGPNSSHNPKNSRSRIFLLLHGANRFLVFWVVIFLALVGVGLQVPGWLKWLPLLGALGAGIRVFWLLAKGMDGCLGWGLAKLAALEVRLRRLTRPDWHGWRWVLGGCGAMILALSIWQAWPSWEFLGTSSLREDEILNIEQYTSRGFARPATSYSLARNHIFYNILSSIIPGSSSTWPPRARALSFLSVGAGLCLLVAYAWRRGWLIPGAFFAGLIAGNHMAMKTLLEARGYGMIFCLGVVASIAFAEWARTRSVPWLIVMAAAVVAGSYTLPYFLIFGGILLLLAWLAKPSRQTFGVGLLAAVSIIMLYLPLAIDVIRVAAGYGKEYEDGSRNNFASIDAVMRVSQFFVPYDLINVGPAALMSVLAVVMAFVAAARFVPAWARLTVGVVAAGLAGMAAFFLLIGAVPFRTAAFLGGPQAVIAITVIGSVFGATAFRSIKPLLHVGFAVMAVGILGRLDAGEPLIPRQNWRDMGIFLERAFPGQTRLWASKSYGKLIEWNLGDRRPLESGEKDAAAFLGGRLVMVDAEFNSWGEDRRPGWGDFPDGFRFVTFPLLHNYHRVFFMPPPSAGVISVTAGGVSLPLDVAGFQAPDPATVSQSGGHGDTLLKQERISGIPQAIPPEISLPATIIARVEPAAGADFCNFLFTRSLENLQIHGSWQDVGGHWHTTKGDFLSGEFLSVRIPPYDCQAVRLEIRKDSPEGNKSLGLLNIWLN